MSTSPRLSAASRVASSGMTLKTRRLHDGWLAPVRLVRLHHQLDPGLEGDELVRAGATGAFLKPSSPTCSRYFFGHDPRRAGRGRGVERHEVRPRLLEPEAHAVGIHHLDRGHLRLEQARAGATVTLERELHVVRGQRVAVVKGDAPAQHELVHEAVAAHRPRRGERGPHRGAGQRAHEGVVDRVVDHERQRGPGGLGGIEERGRQGDVHAPRDGARGRGRGLGRGRRNPEQEQETRERSPHARGRWIGNAGGTIWSTVAPSHRQLGTRLQ